MTDQTLTVERLDNLKGQKNAGVLRLVAVNGNTHVEGIELDVLFSMLLLAAKAGIEFEEGEDIANAPRDRTEVQLKAGGWVRAYWDPELNTWVLSSPLHIESIPLPKKFKPLPPEEEPPREVKLKPGWLARDVRRATDSAKKMRGDSREEVMPSERGSSHRPDHGQANDEAHTERYVTKPSQDTLEPVGAPQEGETLTREKIKQTRGLAARGYEAHISADDQVALCDLALKAIDAEELHIVFDGPPSHRGGRFVEVETASGKSVSGEWRKRPDGLWALVLNSEWQDCAKCNGTGAVDTPFSGSDPVCGNCDGEGKISTDTPTSSPPPGDRDG